MSIVGQIEKHTQARLVALLRNRLRYDYWATESEEIKVSARTVVGGGEKILNRARLMEEEISKRLSALGAQMQRLRNATGEGSN